MLKTLKAAFVFHAQAASNYLFKERMEMEQTDTGQARRRRVRRLKKLIVIVPLFTILLLSGVCVFLGIRLHLVSRDLREALAVLDTVSAIDRDAAAENAADGAGASLYTVSGIDTVEKTAADAGENAPGDSAAEIHKVYLTFDDGPSSNTGRILDILAEYDVKATFFVVGKEDEQYRELYRRIVDEGHTLAMHSYSHKYDEIYQSVESYSADLTKLQEFLYDTTGVWCRYCRFPGGSSNTVSHVDMHELIDYLDEQDISYFDWNISSGDAAGAPISAEDIVRNCTARLGDYDEAIILMHDAAGKNSTVAALPALIEKIQGMGNAELLPITDDTERIHHISND